MRTSERYFGVILFFLIFASHSLQASGSCESKFEISARKKHSDTSESLVTRGLQAMDTLRPDLAWPQRLILSAFGHSILNSILTRAEETGNNHIHQLQILARMEVLRWQRRLNTWFIVPGVGVAITAGSVGLLGIQGLTVPGILALSGILFTSLRHAPAYRFRNMMERGSWRMFSAEAGLESRDHSARHLIVSIEHALMGDHERGVSWPIARTAGYLDGEAALKALEAGDIDAAVEIIVEKLLTIRAVDVGNFYVLSLSYDPSLQPSPQVALWLYAFRTSFWKPAIKKGLLLSDSGEPAFASIEKSDNGISRSKFIIRISRLYMASLYQMEGAERVDLISRVAEHNDESAEEERQNFRLNRQRVNSILLRLLPKPSKESFESLYPFAKQAASEFAPGLFELSRTVDGDEEAEAEVRH